MFEQLTANLKIKDEFIQNRIKFINQLIAQRKLKIEFELILQKNNLANKILVAKEIKTKNGQLLGEISFAVCNCSAKMINKRKNCPISLTTLYVQIE